EMGFQVPIFLVENISLPPNVEEALDKRTSMGIVGNLDQYMKFQAATAMEKAAASPAGGAGEGMGLGMGFGMANAMMHNMNAANPGTPGGAVPPPLTAAAPWWAAPGGTQTGQFDPRALQAQIAAGAISRETLVWRQGM